MNSNVVVGLMGRRCSPARDAGLPRCRGLLGHAGIAPAELRHAGREQPAEHPNVEVRTTAVVGAQRRGATLAVALEDGSRLCTRALVLAHGLRYDPPPLPGIAPLWGSSVFHCAFCDGWEVRDRPLAVTATVKLPHARRS
jgi:thioredoxin reductase